MRKRILMAVLLCSAVVSGASAVDRMVGLVPSDGVGMFVKEFSVSAGTTITGAQFANNDPATEFPEVLLVRGPLRSISAGTTVASATNVRESSGGVVAVTWSTPVVVSQAGTYYVTVRIPAGQGKEGAGRGAAIGANNAATATGNYTAGGTDGVLVPVRADLGISLVTGSSKASGHSVPPGSTEKVQPFLRASEGASGVTIDFGGLDRESQVHVSIYDVHGRHVREVVQEVLSVGSHRRTWDGLDERGARVAAGVYVFKLQAGETSLTKKIVKSR